MMYKAVPIVNDESTKMIYELQKEILGYTVELYIEKEEHDLVPLTPSEG